jgi:hypothetical protein
MVHLFYLYLCLFGESRLLVLSRGMQVAGAT